MKQTVTMRYICLVIIILNDICNNKQPELSSYEKNIRKRVAENKEMLNKMWQVKYYCLYNC